ncbi:hypothetical protein [Mycobacterium sp. TY815]|uniref:hypothetical protein n=1 Tax=unclassified Mycobacterium TaxID=2642494 RepID=UPI00274061A8|nr:hypothetical protein [Mycobacterium sp. TY815]MDP7707118.1 hypothetical protein [Mycobacterium sp. TY815]
MRWYARPENRPLGFEPRLASWNKSDDPAQVRLRAYLDETEALLAGSRIDGPWALRLDVGLPATRDLLDAADLDNYAYPLAHRLGDPGLVSVWCTKEHSERSMVRIDTARELPAPSTDVVIARTTASSSTVAFKEQIRSAVAEATELPHGPVRLELSFVVGPGRNWLNLWKQTIDSLDPLLGRTYPDRLWHPRDGRITELGMHVTVDPAAGNQVVVGINAELGRMSVSPYGRLDLGDKVLINQPGTRDHRRVGGLVGLGPGDSSLLEIGQQTFGGPSISNLTIVDIRIPEGVVITDLVGHAGPCRDTEGKPGGCDVILAWGHLTPDDHELRSFRCGGSIDPPVISAPELQEANPKDDTQVALRAAARANGWQVLAANNDEDIYSLLAEPDKRIRVSWSAAGTVLFAHGGQESFIHRTDGFPDSSGKTERLMTALRDRTDVIPLMENDIRKIREKLTGLHEYRDDDAHYQEWLAAFPDGYVINIRRDHSAAAARVHRARCRTISGQDPQRGPWTGRYVKVCAKELADLQQWATDHVGKPIPPCGTCRPKFLN